MWRSIGNDNPISTVEPPRKSLCEGLTGGGEIFTRQVHLKVNRPSSSDSGLVIEPAISGDNDVVTVVLGATRDALRFDLETVPAKQFPQGNVAQVIGNASAAGDLFSAGSRS